MAKVIYQDLYDAAAVANVEQQLLGRLDPGVQGITSTESEKKRVTGLIGRCANTGYLIGRVGGQTLFTIDLAILNVLVWLLPLNIEVPVGQTLGLFEMSTSGTAACSVTAQYELM
jgi:hypothetical protein